jgi:hypothetical protein
MRPRIALITTVAAGLLASGPSLADHNSKHGAGWARMPNDIHNTRIDTRAVDNEAFSDFVRYGNGADSVNRFPTREPGEAHALPARAGRAPTSPPFAVRRCNAATKPSSVGETL